MTDCIKRSFWQGDYTTLDTAKQIIGLNSFKDKTKELMFDILNSRKPIEEKFNGLAINYNYSSKQILRMKNKFKKSGICPVTIPIRDSHKCGEFLIGIVNLFSK